MTMVEWFAEAQFHQKQNEGQKPVKGHLSDAEVERLKLLLGD